MNVSSITITYSNIPESQFEKYDISHSSATGSQPSVELYAKKVCKILPNITIILEAKKIIYYIIQLYCYGMLANDVESLILHHFLIV